MMQPATPPPQFMMQPATPPPQFMMQPAIPPPQFMMQPATLPPQVMVPPATPPPQVMVPQPNAAPGMMPMQFQNRGAWFFHYTDYNAIQNIRQTGVINASSFGAYGPGVYLTRLYPENQTTSLSWNNYDDGLPNIVAQIQAGRLDCVVAVWLQENDPFLQPCVAVNRDIFVYGDNLYLGDKCPMFLDRKNAYLQSRPSLDPFSASPIQTFPVGHAVTVY